MTLHMVAWMFAVRRQPDGEVRPVTFYARTRPEALKLARAWAKRMNFEIEDVGEFDVA